MCEAPRGPNDDGFDFEGQRRRDHIVARALGDRTSQWCFLQITMLACLMSWPSWSTAALKRGLGQHQPLSEGDFVKVAAAPWAPATLRVAATGLRRWCGLPRRHGSRWRASPTRPAGLKHGRWECAICRGARWEWFLLAAVPLEPLAIRTSEQGLGIYGASTASPIVPRHFSAGSDKAAWVATDRPLVSALPVEHPLAALSLGIVDSENCSLDKSNV